MAHHQHAVGFADALNTSIFIVEAVAAKLDRGCSALRPVVCTENLNADVMMMKPAEECM
jgi:hypothetical protein